MAKSETYGRMDLDLMTGILGYCLVKRVCWLCMETNDDSEIIIKIIDIGLRLKIASTISWIIYFLCITRPARMFIVLA